MKELTMHNGEVRDKPSVCHACSQPNPQLQAEDGEWYHVSCLPEDV